MRLRRPSLCFVYDGGLHSEIFLFFLYGRILWLVLTGKLSDACVFMRVYVAKNFVTLRGYHQGEILAFIANSKD